jgi:hypothetical protein
MQDDSTNDDEDGAVEELSSTTLLISAVRCDMGVIRATNNRPQHQHGGFDRAHEIFSVIQSLAIE